MTMKFLTDENIAASVVHALRDAGFDVKDVKEEQLYGVSDKEVLQLASREDRVIITHDKDFANILSFSRISHKGIILLRLQDQRSSNVGAVLLRVLRSGLSKKIQNNLLVVSEENITIHRQIL